MAHPLLAAGVSRWWKLHRSLPGGGSKLQGLPTHDADDDQHDDVMMRLGMMGIIMVEFPLITIESSIDNLLVGSRFTC